jgi:hypothetical protein
VWKEDQMKKLFSSRLAVAANAAFVATAVLSGCANPPEKKNLSPEETARLAEEKKEADDKRAQAIRNRIPSNMCPGGQR